jgi:aspartyl protease family protein
MYLARNVEPHEAELKPTAVQTAAAARPVQAPPRNTGTVVTIPRSGGQFYTQARVNSGSVKFLVDTGASTVALTLEDARKSGIRTHQLSYDVPVDTANGRTMAARVSLKNVAIGGVRVSNVEGLVIEEGLHVSLLGMTFLGELQKVEVFPERMILRR